MEKEYSVFLVDDHTIVRNGLKGLIESMGNYKITRQYDNGEQFVNDIPFATPPDLVILDLNMPVMDGKETMEWLKRHHIQLPVLVLTLDTSDSTIIELFRLGVKGYLLKSCSAEILKRGIDDIIHTGFYHNELLPNALRGHSKHYHPDDYDKKREELLNLLTDKELAFLRLVCDAHEYTYDEMTNVLNVHRRTIDNYRIAIFDKFDVKSKTGLVLFAIKYKLIDI